MIKITPLGIDTPECPECGEWVGSSDGLVDSVRRHSICFNALVLIQEMVSSDAPDMKKILDLTIKTIGDRRESTETS